MTLAVELGIGDQELVAFIGGGGKTSLLLQLAHELVGRAPVLITTTTKLGIDQSEGCTACWSVEAAAAALGDRPGRPVCLFAGHDGRKVHGLDPEQVDDLYLSRIAPYLLVEADGSRRRPLKAPSAHEPVVPQQASLVIVVVGIDAVGATYAEAAHRPSAAVRLSGGRVDDPITARAVAGIVTHPEGGLKGIPDAARVVVAITKVDEAAAAHARTVRELVAGSDRIEGVVVVERF